MGKARKTPNILTFDIFLVVISINRILLMYNIIYSSNLHLAKIIFNDGFEVKVYWFPQLLFPCNDCVPIVLLPNV